MAVSSKASYSKARSLANLFKIYNGPTANNTFNPKVTITYKSQVVDPAPKTPTKQEFIGNFNKGFDSNTFFQKVRAAPESRAPTRDGGTSNLNCQFQLA